MLLFPIVLVFTTHAQSPGDVLRLKLKSRDSVEGKLFELKEDALSIVVGPELMFIPIDEVVKAEYLAGQSTYALEGGLMGLGGGIISTIVLWCVSGCGIGHLLVAGIFWESALVVGLPSAILGASIGSMVEKNHWELMVLTRPPSNVGLVGVGVRLTL